MRVIGIIQARLGSVRFPQKILKQIPPESGMSMLEMVVRKALLATKLDEVIVVTPDRFVAVLCNRWNVKAYMPFWNGRDVLREFYEAAKEEKADVIVRLTGDCPFTQPDIIDAIVEKYHRNPCALVYNTECLSGNMLNDGYDVECFSYEALKQSYFNAKGDEREHVTAWIRRNMNISYENIPNEVGISVDTVKDYSNLCAKMMFQK